MAGLYDLNTIPESVRLAMDIMVEASEAAKAEMANLRRKLAIYERDHEAMESLRNYHVRSVSRVAVKSCGRYLARSGVGTTGVNCYADDPADAILSAAGEREEAKP